MGKAIVFGAGQMGAPIAHALKVLGHDVTVYDNLDNNIEKSKAYLGSSGNLGNGYLSLDGIRVMKASVEDIDSLETNADVIVSALPFWCNLILSKYCIEKEIPYCDLGGDVKTTDEIVRFAKLHATSPIATDQGLAPGLVNITAERGCELLNGEPCGIFMAVGGLPENKGDNPLNYVTTWSIDGLINEYKGEGWGIVEGERVSLPALEGLQNVSLGGEELEAFYTSGGTAHTIDAMLERNVQYCVYKTLRYPGHRDLIDFLMNTCKYSDEEMSNVFKSWCENKFTNDTVRLYIDEWRENGLSWHKEHVFFAGNIFSAMQRTTGYSIASVADILANDLYWHPNETGSVLTYEMLNVPAFHENFNTLLASDAVEEELPWI